MVRLYRTLTLLIRPLLPLYAKFRLLKGKEDRARIRERFGVASAARPLGRLVWVHAASVGESMAVLPLIEQLRNRYRFTILVTTGTVTSAKLLAERLPSGVIHQYIPYDDPVSVANFLEHWKPGLALWVESELWPNLITETATRSCTLILLNARMSGRSFKRWRMAKGFAHLMLKHFALILAQGVKDQQRFQTLGAQDVRLIGNLKWDAPPLPADPAALSMMENPIGNRPIWLAASTHPGEEAVIIETHRQLNQRFPRLLTILIPRHAQRGASIMAQFKQAALNASQRSRNDPLTLENDIYLVDTMGEMGLFYRLSPVVFMGGSLIKHGGQNPLEPARLHAALITGPYTHNFAEIYAELEAQAALIRVYDALTLCSAVEHLLQQPNITRGMAARAFDLAEAKRGILARVLSELEPYLEKV